MGTTLQNGVYLPNEGERNCYAGLKTNWEILDQKVADVTALQQAVAGALHRQIVTQLPTEDIDPNTIYMILSGTSATENVYNEFMYVNNAWELIGTSATDLTNYYTKSEVDGKLLLKASASDLTSHTGDTTIHVTTADKNKWNNQTYVFRYSSTALTASSTNSNALLDNTDNLKVGDKVIDSSGVLFSITAIDSVNSTFTIGSALVDLALDANVVHTSGNETINGVKSFINYFLGKNLSGQTVDLNDCVDAYGGAIHYYYAVSNYTNISNKPENKPFILESKTVRYVSSIDYIYYQKIYTADYNAPPSIYTRYYRSGSASWSNWVKDTDKFVTTDTAQTVSGNKTFSSNVNVYNSDSATDTANIILKNSKAERGSTTNTGEQTIFFLDKDNAQLGNIKCEVDANGTSTLTIQCTNSSNSNSGIRLRRTSTGTFLQPTFNNGCNLGTSGYRWYDVQTRAINGVEPSSLSLPDIANKIDISSYITDLAGGLNNYTPPANGWICVQVDNSSVNNYIRCTYDVIMEKSSGNGQAAALSCLIPVIADTKVGIRAVCTTLSSAYFIPCLGNV